MSSFTPPATVREGADEVRAKLRQDLSRLTRFRRGISLKPTMGCIECDATGRVPCSSCAGSGQAKIVLGDKPEPCHTCDGRGTVTCIECAGRGRVPNVHRKKVLWLLGIGGLAWAFVLYRMWGGDVLPEQVASLKGGGGKAVPAARRMQGSGATGLPRQPQSGAPAAVPGAEPQAGAPPMMAPPGASYSPSGAPSVPGLGVPAAGTR